MLIPDPDRPDTFLTSTGQTITNVHPPERCDGMVCVVHNPSNHHMAAWPLHWRNDRRIFERLCEHGVGHPDPDCLYDEIESVHGCDGCCRPKELVTT